MDRVILHSDLNNFYASVECLYNPEIREKPVAVCGSQSTRHGIVLAKNRIAKGFGVKAGDAIWEARSKCPGLVVVRPNYMQYLKFSILARKIYEDYTNLVEAFGIDENWLDVTEHQALRVGGKNSQ
jgi:DNA polymerase-4